MISAAQALDHLKHGNQRYVSGKTKGHDPARHHAGMQGQSPFAVVIGCSDSRAPVEMIFDLDVGDLFTVRVAGNVVAPPETGTVEFAVENLGTRLVVVLGHTHCGAVTAAVDALADPAAAPRSPNLASFVDPIKTAIASTGGSDRSDRIHKGVRANAQASVRTLTEQSEILRNCSDLKIVAAEYALETGAVTFLD